MNRVLGSLALGVVASCIAWADLHAEPGGRGGGGGRGGMPGGGMARGGMPGGGMPGGMGRGGMPGGGMPGGGMPGGGMPRGGMPGGMPGGGMPGGGMNHSPAMSQPRMPMNGGRPQANNFGGVNQGAAGNRLETGNRGGIGNTTVNANQNRTNINVGNNTAAGVGNRNLQNTADGRWNGINNNNLNAAGYGNRYRYDGYHPGVVNGYWHGNYYPAAGFGLGYGLGAWGAGSPMYGWGYSGYSNPYYGAGLGLGGIGGSGLAVAPAGQPVVDQGVAAAYDYSQPINTAAAPPDQAVADTGTALFDQAREAFQAGDYAKALSLDNMAMKQMPDDATLHEFLGLSLFALGQYEKAAVPLYAVLSIGPGWDWTTLIGMYADADTYTKQLRDLETYTDSNPKSAQAFFVLGYHYMCQGASPSALSMFQQVVKLQPDDKLAAGLVKFLQPTDVAATPTEAAPAPAPAPAGKQGTLPGKWTATPAAGAKIELAIQPDGNFTWTVNAPNQKQPAKIAGSSTYEDGLLTLSDADQKNGALAGNLAWTDATHFTFKIVGGPADDPGLKFSR